MSSGNSVDLPTAPLTAEESEPSQSASKHSKKIFGQTWSGVSSDAKSPPNTWSGVGEWTDLLGQARIRGNPLTVARLVAQPAAQSTKPTSPGRRCGLTRGNS